MKFPGSKRLHGWDLAVQRLTLEELMRSCQQAGLTGFAEFRLSQGAGMILYYMGGEVNVLYRTAASVAAQGPLAIERLREAMLVSEGSVTIHELPLDLAHLLRGVVKRQRLAGGVASSAALAVRLDELEHSAHTGTLEVQCASGAAIMLLLQGHVANVYWETESGQTYEKGEARERLEAALEEEPARQVFLSHFSRDAWKNRHATQGFTARHAPPGREQASADEVAAAEAGLRDEILAELFRQVPACVQALVIDLVTGVVVASRVRGADGLRVALLAGKLPGVVRHLSDLLAAEGEDTLELVELASGRAMTIAAILPELREAVAVIADRSQPGPIVAAALSRCCQLYAERVRPARVRVG